MENLYNFDQYVNECYTQGVRETVNSILYEGLFESNYLNTAEKNFLKKVIFENNITHERLDETFLTKIRDSIKAAKEKGLEVAKKVGDAAMDKLATLAKSASDFTNYIVDKIKQLWGWATTKYAENKEKHKAAIKQAIEKSKDKIIKPGAEAVSTLAADVKNLSVTLAWWTKEFIGTVMDKLKNVLSKVLLAESLTWKGEMILEFTKLDIKAFDKLNEGDGHDDGKFSWLKKLVHTLAKIPPFSVLGEIRKKLTESFGSFLVNISDATHKMGGPGVYEFAALTIILGALAEYAVKTAGSRAAVAVIPFAGTIVHILGYVALGILFVEVIEELMKEGEKQKAGPEDGTVKQAPAAKPTAPEAGAPAPEATA